MCLVITDKEEHIEVIRVECLMLQGFIFRVTLSPPPSVSHSLSLTLPLSLILSLSLSLTTISAFPTEFDNKNLPNSVLPS